MSTETQRAEFAAFVLEKTGRDMEYHGRAGTTGLAFAYACWRAAQSSQAAEIEALKAKLAIYEAHGVTCQTFGHVVGACAECNTHEESNEAS